MSPVVIIGMIVVSVALIAFALIPRGRDNQDSVRRRMAGKRSVDDVAALRDQARESVTRKMVERVAPLATRPVMPKSAEELSKLNLRLANAGFRRENACNLFLASKTILGILFCAVGLLYTIGRGNDMQHIVSWTVVAAAVGFMGPNVWLRMAIDRRAELVRNGLPDSLDLLVISVESGLALDAGIQRVGDEMKNVHPILSEEFQIAALETQMGIPRSEALSNMSARTGVDEMKSLVSIVNQAERFGTSIARALRNQADALRVKRKQAAEERAQKTTVKLMLPLIMFIFPAIFVVLAGPAALRLMSTLGNNPNL